MKKPNRSTKPKSAFPRFYGRHAVIAALANPDRIVRKIWGTREALGALDLPQMIALRANQAMPGHGRAGRYR